MPNRLYSWGETDDPAIAFRDEWLNPSAEDHHLEKQLTRPMSRSGFLQTLLFAQRSEISADGELASTGARLA
jgi:hypothetical protein